MFHNSFLYENVVITKIENYAAASTTDATSTVLDMAGFDGVMFVAFLGTVTDASDLTLAAWENATNDTVTPSAITGATTGVVAASTSSNKYMVLDIKKNAMAQRYVYCILTIDTQNAAIDNVIAIRYGARSLPVTADSGVLAAVTVAA